LKEKKVWQHQTAGMSRLSQLVFLAAAEKVAIRTLQKNHFSPRFRRQALENRLRYAEINHNLTEAL
jgi:hypothetical protein